MDGAAQDSVLFFIEKSLAPPNTGLTSAVQTLRPESVTSYPMFLMLFGPLEITRTLDLITWPRPQCGISSYIPCTSCLKISFTCSKALFWTHSPPLLPRANKISSFFFCIHLFLSVLITIIFIQKCHAWDMHGRSLLAHPCHGQIHILQPRFSVSQLCKREEKTK